MFVDKPQTYELMKETMYLPELADRDARLRWAQRGALDTHARAMQRVREILSRENSAGFAPDVDARIRAVFPDLVAGDVLMPEGWK
jgi:trimethylamine:corrinoid methyltransferase-like protein